MRRVVLSAVQWKLVFVVQDSTDIWFCGFLCGYSKITTIATSTTTATTTATAERLFETLRVYVSSTTTTIATSTATTTASATAKRLFEALRVYCSVILSTDRGLMVIWFIEHSFCGLRFCGSATATIATDVFYACKSSTSGRGLMFRAG